MLLVGAIGCFVAVALLEQRLWQLAAAVAGLTFVLLILLQRSSGWFAHRADLRDEARLAKLIGLDATPCFTTDAHGQIGFQNPAAQSRFGAADGSTLVSALKDHFAAPSAVLYRLQSRASHSGSAREDVATRRGHVRLSVHQLKPGRFLWRLEEFQDRSSAGRGAESLSLPMLTVRLSCLRICWKGLWGLG